MPPFTFSVMWQKKNRDQYDPMLKAVVMVVLMVVVLIAWLYARDRCVRGQSHSAGGNR